MYEEHGAIVYWQPREKHWIAETSGMEICRGYGESRLEALEALETEIRLWQATRREVSLSLPWEAQRELDLRIVKEKFPKSSLIKEATIVPQPTSRVAVGWSENILQGQQKMLADLLQVTGKFKVNVDPEQEAIFLAGEVELMASSIIDKTMSTLVDAGTSTYHCGPI